MKNLVLLGGGYGNMRIMSRILPDSLPENYTLTLIDRMPFHGLKPEFYALVAGTKSDSDVRMNFPDSERVNTIYGEINDIDLDAQIVSVGNTKVDYDELVIGLGCEDKYHNVPGLRNTRIVFKHSPRHAKHFIVLVNYLVALV